MNLKLCKKKNVRVLTWQGWLLILIVLFFIMYLFMTRVYGFLKKNTESQSKVLVVEGWVPDDALREAIKLYDSCKYEYMIVTGIPITQWTFSSPYSNMADASARSLKEMFFKDSIYTINIPTSIVRDRTYSTAVGLKAKWDSYNIPYNTFDLFSMGPHSRRSFNMYEKVFGKRITGIISAEDTSYNSEKWYTTSRGFRAVLSELLTYSYALLFFHPDESKIEELIRQGHYVDSIQTERFAKDREFDKKETSPLNDTSIRLFRGLKYYPIDSKYRVKAYFEVDTTAPSFKMKTSGVREPEYRKYGVLHFKLNDTIQQLTVYQNIDYLKKNPNSDYLFVPFKDLTAPEFTYGGGRYLDLEFPKSDSVTIDFNKVYNPYCAYDGRWSCPIPPVENHLSTYIKAGEKKFHD